MVLPHLDEIDQRIVNLLLENGRLPYAKIGESLCLSRVAIQKRVESLIEDGIIEHFTIRVNVAKLGKPVAVYFEIVVEPRLAEQIGYQLAELPDVINIYQMTGPSTLHMQAHLRDEEELEKFLYEKIFALEGVVSVDTQLVIRNFKPTGI
ncbi:DNA-binding Lrp family transcriptional regulator [Paenibacillus cellulosilyticus]|uniref:DNA-binding Lrp family transcriptional regulator n=1 Tax=Paenibacillus cellulosilyticus TaxID=375489 RepID=A0A2V2YP03_9BACL|nr:Lrp/AsnC family transcriptional regulator [Paenibacillus cellulosilyticus]PWV97834.1 DNA-binding Lrp family transcriptional regulator [Paenibacillus cellulosilyticus]QKS46991.1 Lrp/AsnC family transcriptional regulator [Paenibacillus cellulosilyticus]